MVALLDEMEICIANKTALFDVLDCDLSGELELSEVVSGLMMLRGPTDKTDAVASLLGIRYITRMLEGIYEVLHEGSAARDVQTHELLASMSRVALMQHADSSTQQRCSRPGFT